MKLYKKLLVVALAAMPAAALQAQTYNDTVRTNTWTVYGAGGISGYHGLRGGSDTGVRTAIAPDLSVGVKYNIKPWVRVGLNLGYTKIKALNNGIAHTQTITNNFQIGNYNDGVLTVDKMILVNRSDIHFAGADMNIDFNLLELFKNRNQRWNIWLGTGAGYLHGWHRGTLTTAVSEEGIAKGDDHFNVYNNDYVTTETSSCHINSMYIPARLSLEYDITPRWTIGAKGEYKYLPLDKALTPKGLWSANISLAYNFVGKRYNKKSIKAHYEEIIDGLNTTIGNLKESNKACALRIDKLENDIDEARAALADCKGAPQTMSVNNVFYDLNKSIINKEQIKNVNTVAQVLDAYPDSKAYIKGYASTEGNADRNNALAEQRAKAVADMLVKEFNIEADRIFTEGCGATDSLYKVFELNRVAVITVENVNK